jgi:hypothetical protein
MKGEDILEAVVRRPVGQHANSREKIYIPNLSNSDGGDAKVRSRQPWWWS